MYTGQTDIDWEKMFFLGGRVVTRHHKPAYSISPIHVGCNYHILGHTRANLLFQFESPIPQDKCLLCALSNKGFP